MKEIYTVAMTGGPCAGKSTMIDFLSTELEKNNIKCIVIPETATEIINDKIHWRDTNVPRYDFQEAVFSLQLAKENVFFNLAQKIDYSKIVILCDRGLMDGKAYIDETGFNKILKSHGFSSEDEILKRYDLVLHLETSANLGSETYETKSNKARTANIIEALTFDNNVKRAWENHSNIKAFKSTPIFDNKKQAIKTELFNYIKEASKRQEEKEDERTF